MQVSRIRGVSLIPRLFGTVLLFQILALQAPVRGEESQTATAASLTIKVTETTSVRRSRLFARGDV
jgi:hypothetical protein